MLKRYIKDIVKKELAKEKLNNLYGKVKTEDSWEHRFHNQLKYTETLANKKDREILKLREKNKKLSGDKEVLKTSLMEASEYVKSLEQEDKELSSKDCATNDIYIVQLEDANSKIETIGNMVEKSINKNQKLEEKLTKISNVISLYNTNDITFMSLMSTINNIKNILKES